MIRPRFMASTPVLGAAATTECARLSMSPLADEVAQDVATAHFPGHSQELRDALATRSVKQITAASALPIDAEASRADGWLLERVGSLREEHARARSKANAAREAFEASAERLATFDKPMGFVGWIVVVTGFVCALILFAVSVGALLGPSVDAYLLRSYVDSVFDADTERFAAALAVCIATACALVLMGLQLLAVFAARGRLHWLVKASFVAADVGFAGAFAVMRLGEHFSWQAIAVSLFEFALCLAGLAAILTLAQVLRRDEERAQRYRLADAETKSASRAFAAALDAADVAESRLTEQVRVIEAREDAVRRAARFAELAQATVTAAYDVAVSRLIGEAASNGAEDTLTDRIDSELNSGFARARGSRFVS